MQNVNSEEVDNAPEILGVCELPGDRTQLQTLLKKIEANCVPHLPSLKAVVDKLRLKDRQWEILEARVGFGRRLTLDEVGTLFGDVTRSRAQQVEAQTRRRLDNWELSIGSALIMLEAQARSLWPSPPVATVDAAVPHYSSVLASTGWDSPSKQDVRRLLLVLRALVHYGKGAVGATFPSLTYAACTLRPAILRHPRVADEERQRNRKWTYLELAERVLAAAGEPLHYTEIFKRAEALGLRESISLHSMHNAIGSATDRFALTGQGTFGLTEWGLTAVTPYPDIIALAMKRVGKTISYGEILQAVNAERSIKESSLILLLSTHPRFYQDINGFYGLRAWLPPREKQTLRTPRWLIEAPDSRQRIERSIERGYDVASIVARDKDSAPEFLQHK